MKRALVLILTIFAIIGFYLPAMAIGIGGSFTAGVAKVYWTDLATEGSGSATLYGGSIIFDTAVAKNSLFNYRANFAIQAINADTEADSGEEGKKLKFETEGIRYALFNSFGFGVVRTESVRFWLGPQIGIHYVDADTTKTEDRLVTLYPVGPTYLPIYTDYKQKKEDNGVGASFGLVLGVNINIGPAFTLGLDGGCRGFITGSAEVANAGPEGFVNVSLIFRISDTY